MVARGMLGVGCFTGRFYSVIIRFLFFTALMDHLKILAIGRFCFFASSAAACA